MTTDLEAITQAVNMVGFPIVAFLLMFWFSVKIVRENTKAIQGLILAINTQNQKQQTLPIYTPVEHQYKKP